VSINLKEERAYWLSVSAVFLFIFGSYFVSMLFPDPGFLIIFIGVVAFILFILGILLSDSYYKFNATSINPEDWKIKDTKSERGKKFVQVIRSHCFFEEATERIKYCPKCGTKNPENSNYCSSCGASLNLK